MQYGLKPICRNCEHSDGYNHEYECKCCRIDNEPICPNKRNRCRNPKNFKPHFSTLLKFNITNWEEYKKSQDYGQS